MQEQKRETQGKVYGSDKGGHAVGWSEYDIVDRVRWRQIVHCGNP